MRSWGAIQCIIDVNVLRRTREIFIDLKDFHVFCSLLGFFFGVACTVPVARDQYTALFWRASLERLSDCTIDNDGRDYCLIKSTLFSLSSLFFWKKNEVHIESQKGAGLYLIILLSRHLNGCALFFVNVKEE